jgi:DNA-binding response OmpR family regulator
MDSKGRILLIEDNEDLNEDNYRALTAIDYEVDQALTLASARERLAAKEPDIILLDIILPDGDGVEFCKEIRGKTSAHIIFLTSKSDKTDAVCGLAAGGDDYVKKPYHPEELFAKVEAVTRRREMNAPQTLTKGNLTLDINALIAYVNGENILLKPREFTLLLHFAQNEDKYMSAEALYEKAWGQPMAGDGGALKTTVSRLRKKIDGSGYTIDANRGVGYRFERV